MICRCQRSVPVLAAALAWLGLAGPAGFAAGHRHAHGHPVAGPVTGTVNIKVLGGEIRAELQYTNVSSRIVWLEKLEEGQAPMRPEFEVRSDGRQVPYTGPMAKRKPYTRADFFALEPGRTHTREVRLDDRYAFQEGARTYTATHSYLLWNDRTRQAVHRSLPSATFTYTR